MTFSKQMMESNIERTKKHHTFKIMKKAVPIDPCILRGPGNDHAEQQNGKGTSGKNCLIRAKNTLIQRESKNQKKISDPYWITLADMIVERFLKTKELHYSVSTGIWHHGICKLHSSWVLCRQRFPKYAPGKLHRIRKPPVFV